MIFGGNNSKMAVYRHTILWQVYNFGRYTYIHECNLLYYRLYQMFLFHQFGLSAIYATHIIPTIFLDLGSYAQCTHVFQCP